MQNPLEKSSEKRSDYFTQSESRTRRSEDPTPDRSIPDRIAHELGNPLGAIQLSAERALALLPGQNNTEEIRDILITIIRSADRCAGTIRRILRSDDRDDSKEDSHENRDASQ